MIKEGLSGKNTTELMFEERLGVTLTRECNLGQKNCMCKGPEVRTCLFHFRNIVASRRAARMRESDMMGNGVREKGS